MSTATPRLQLTKPLGSESMVLGAAQLNDAYSKIDAAMGVKKFATQGAATATFPGDLIVETSTGQSKLFTNPNWANIFDSNNGRGIPQDFTPTFLTELFIVSGFGEFDLLDQVFTVEALRKYLVNFNFGLSAQNDGGTPLQGFVRLVFKYTTDISNLGVPNIFIHDVASFVTAVNASRSKSFKGMFEFFPNLTGKIKLGIFGQVITGAQDVQLNLTNSIPSMYLTDWGT